MPVSVSAKPDPVDVLDVDQRVAAGSGAHSPSARQSDGHARRRRCCNRPCPSRRRRRTYRRRRRCRKRSLPCARVQSDRAAVRDDDVVAVAGVDGEQHIAWVAMVRWSSTLSAPQIGESLDILDRPAAEDEGLARDDSGGVQGHAPAPSRRATAKGVGARPAVGIVAIADRERVVAARRRSAGHAPAPCRARVVGCRTKTRPRPDGRRPNSPPRSDVGAGAAVIFRGRLDDAGDVVIAGSRRSHAARLNSSSCRTISVVPGPAAGRDKWNRSCRCLRRRATRRAAGTGRRCRRRRRPRQA